MCFQQFLYSCAHCKCRKTIYSVNLVSYYRRFFLCAVTFCEGKCTGKLEQLNRCGTPCSLWWRQRYGKTQTAEQKLADPVAFCEGKCTGKPKQLNRSMADPVAFCEGKFVGKLKQLNWSMAKPYSLLWRQICGKTQTAEQKHGTSL